MGFLRMLVLNVFPEFINFRGEPLVAFFAFNLNLSKRIKVALHSFNFILEVLDDAVVCL